jgi:C-3',4' desaturase CrtD
VFDVGATLFAGFQPGGAHHYVAERLKIHWPVRRLEPAMEVWLPDARVARWGDARWAEERMRVFGEDSERFWRSQERTADIAWRFAARLPPMPPEHAADIPLLARTVRPEMLGLLPGLFRTVRHELDRQKANNRRLHAYVDGQLLISAQTTAETCAWLYGAAALDFARIGAHYAEGGAWSLARTLVAALERDGGEICYRSRVSRILTDHGRATGVEVNGTERLAARHIVANLTIWDAAELLGEAAPRRLHTAIAQQPPGWGAFTLYLGVDESAFPPGFAEHHQVIGAYGIPLGEANSVFVSLHPADDLSRAPAGQRAVTISTHTAVERWLRWRTTDPQRYREEKAAMAERVLTTASRAIPRLRDAVRYMQIGTPVSFQRYTRRNRGMVGGIPQGLLNYGFLSIGPRATGIGNLWLVGDTTFPGQSTAAVTQSAIRVWQAIRREQPFNRNATVP